MREPHKCSICDYATSIKGHLKQHIESVHEKIRPHKCFICDNSFSQKGGLKVHIDAVHEGKKPHKCSICDYSFSQKGDLKKHVEAIHEGKKPHKCSICDYSFSQKGVLRKHIKSVHEGKKGATQSAIWTCFLIYSTVVFLALEPYIDSIAIPHLKFRTVHKRSNKKLFLVLAEKWAKDVFDFECGIDLNVSPTYCVSPNNEYKMFNLKYKM